MRMLRVLTAATCLASLALGTGPTPVAVAASVGAPSPQPTSTSAAAIKVVAVKTGLATPAAFTFGPSGAIWYVEKGTGKVWVINRRTNHQRLFFDIGQVDSSGERGGLGIALHPAWPDQPFVYVYVTRNDHGVLENELLRIRSRNGQGVGFRVLFRWKVGSATYHNGGHISFGPGNKLFIVTGENGDPSNSQDKTNLRGKILRINPDGSIPKSNPFGTRIWSFGHRNSFGFAFDPKTGRLWETENGPECNDEINRIVRGGNFGWGPRETCSGSHPHDTNNSGPRPRHLPKTYFLTPIGITGAAFCIACGLGGGLGGDLIFGDVNTSSIRAIGLDAARTGLVVGSRRVLLTTTTGGVFSIQAAPDGRIFFSAPNGIYRLAPT